MYSAFRPFIYFRSSSLTAPTVNLEAEINGTPSALTVSVQNSDVPVTKSYLSDSITVQQGDSISVKITSQNELPSESHPRCMMMSNSCLESATQICPLVVHRDGILENLMVISYIDGNKNWYRAAFLLKQQVEQNLRIGFIRKRPGSLLF